MNQLFSLFSIPFVINKEGRWDSSSCSMYARNYSAEENLAALLQPGGNVSSDIPATVPCQAGWKFQYSDQESTTVVAEVSFLVFSPKFTLDKHCFVSFPLFLSL
jgi:hypothetical protein